MPLRWALLAHLAIALVAALPASAGQQDAANALPEHRASDAGAPAVTAENLLAGEGFWPYHVALVRPWKPAGRETALEPGIQGVLIRVETSTHARIDFGRDGVHGVPISETDLLDRADRVRRGELEKSAPNLAWAIGPRLLGSTSATPVAMGVPALVGYRGFVCVFADPHADGFAELARELAPLRERPGVATLLFPQGQRRDAEVSGRLRSLQWTVPFVYDHLSEGYTRSLLEDGTPLPYVLLLTNEGRVLLQRGPGAELAAEIEREIETSFADAAAPH